MKKENVQKHGWEYSRWEFSGWEFSGEDSLGVNLMGRNFLDGSVPGRNFPDTIKSVLIR